MNVGDKIRLEIDKKMMNVGLIGEYNGLPIRLNDDKVEAEVGEEVLVRIRNHEGTYARGLIIEKYTSSQPSSSGLSGEKEAEPSANSGSQTSKKRISKEQTEESKQKISDEKNSDEKQDNNTIQISGTDLNIDELRKKAEESAVEEVSKEASTSTTQKPQYTRSPEVKEYVKARADGICEGCGEPAPFTSKTGEPYLHAHHIHELSDGGSDTPDTVVALCPNCHYRVHHGEDGDEYNEELLETVQRE
jgi:5-methylcytosine-specific restriction endonuclease McrA